MNEYVPILALVLSVIGLTISILNYWRDSARPKAWCEIVHHEDTPVERGTIPALRIRIANLGRRPVVLTKLEIRGDGRIWYLQLKDADLRAMNNNNIAEVFDLLRKHSLVQNSSVRLLEGDVMELEYRPDDCHHFILVDGDMCATANEIYIRDCTGRRSRISNDSAALKRLFEAWKP